MRSKRQREAAAKVIAGLDALESGDSEAAHGRAEDLLLAWVEIVNPEVAAAWRRAENRIEFWYA